MLPPTADAHHGQATPATTAASPEWDRWRAVRKGPAVGLSWSQPSPIVSLCNGLHGEATRHCPVNPRSPSVPEAISAVSAVVVIITAAHPESPTWGT